MPQPSAFEQYPAFTVGSFSEGKLPPKNEDVFRYTPSMAVLCDGATDKSGLNFDGRTGGEIAADICAAASVETDLNGPDLVAHLTGKLDEFYRGHNPRALEDSAFRFASTLLVARAVDDRLIVTQVGDSHFRLNGRDTYINDKLIDRLTAGLRQKYIAETGDVAGSRDVIMPLLKTQHVYQNQPGHPLGYGCIDGTAVPPRFIRTFTFPLTEVRSLEMVSDGYYGSFPDEPSLEAYERLHRHIEAVDPHKFQEFASTKTGDDRTVAILDFPAAA